jgi:hypothetical protein
VRDLRLAAPPVLVAILRLPAPALADDLRGEGFAFPGALPDVGHALEVVGELDMGTSDPPFEPSDVEYTWTLYGSSVHSIEEPSPGIRYRRLTFGVVEIRADPSFDAVYQPHPPNASVPRTFHDGEVLLLGSVTELTIREIFGIVTASGVVRFEAGSALPAIRNDWCLDAAVSVQGGGEIPPGYGSRWNVELVPGAPVRIDPGTWSNIKALYR